MILQFIAAIVASIVGVLSSLTMLILLMAGLANAKPAHLQQGKWMMWGIILVQAISLTAAVWLMVRHRHWHAAIAGVSPLIIVIVLIIILVKIEW
ncbi:MAG TPA: hypothetical protein VK176_10890 [Phycisphaerales bacterium]|nr:hypothetical protein [Phycisphaerales bacterium]